MTLQEQLQAAGSKLKKVDPNDIKMAKIPNQKEIQMTAQMANLNQQLEKRMKAMGNDKKRNVANSDEEEEESEEEDWEESD